MIIGLTARDAQADAAYKQNVELWTLYALGVAFTILRTVARIGAVGIRNLRLDDYLIWMGIVRPTDSCYHKCALTDRIQIFYTAQTALAYTVGDVANGLANNSMTTAQRIALSPDSLEYHHRYTHNRNMGHNFIWPLTFCQGYRL